MLGRVWQLVRSAGEDEVSLALRSEKAIQMASLEARQLGHIHIDTEHLLLWLIRESEGVADRVLADLGGIDQGDHRAHPVRRSRLAAR